MVPGCRDAKDLRKIEVLKTLQFCFKSLYNIFINLFDQKEGRSRRFSFITFNRNSVVYLNKGFFFFSINCLLGVRLGCTVQKDVFLGTKI